MNEYDELFAEYYQFEMDKVSKWFKFRHSEGKAVYIALAVLLVLDFSFITAFQNSRKFVKIITSSTSESIPIVCYDNTFLIAAIICSAIILLIAIWIMLSIYYEKRAFKRSSRAAADAVAYRRHKENEEWQIFKSKQEI